MDPGISNPLVEPDPKLITWHGDGVVPDVQCTASALAAMAEAAMDGFRRYPWGGVELGGILLGERQPTIVRVTAIHQVDSEHHYGPEFELSNQDYEAFERALDVTANNHSLAGLMPLGWYQSTSRRHLGLSEHARKLFQRLFTEPWHIAMLVQRSKRDPLSVGIFIGDSNGGTKLHSPVQEFTVQALQQTRARSAASE